MVQSTKQFGTREIQVRKANDHSSGLSIETQLSQITIILNKLITGGVQKAVLCRIFYLEWHPTYTHLTLQGRIVNAIFSN